MNHSLSLQLNSNDTGTIVKRLHVWMAQMKPQKEDCSICTSAFVDAVKFWEIIF